ncbi:hypothetical protein K3177_14715 [Qipengyuania sp. GH25]|uniref:Uncharacterized protein n=1 Tax=Qipengyuania pacifica TaxID=2860199 RepID=A0ABS7JK37_9SPHN|nr:hypothetical protein [Qipengyuania aerophila]MBX7489758.1 hypothetical protein [Qipengyuania aerophila]
MSEERVFHGGSSLRRENLQAGERHFSVPVYAHAFDNWFHATCFFEVDGCPIPLGFDELGLATGRGSAESSTFQAMISAMIVEHQAIGP